MSITELLQNIKEGQIARATFGGESWYITMSQGFVRYCNRDGGFVRDAIQLSKSNMSAEYDLIS